MSFQPRQEPFFCQLSFFYLHSVTKVQSISSFLLLIIFLYFNVSYCNYSIRICVPYSRYNKHVTPFLSLLSDSYSDFFSFLGAILEIGNSRRWVSAFYRVFTSYFKLPSQFLFIYFFNEFFYRCLQPVRFLD